MKVSVNDVTYTYFGKPFKLVIDASDMSGSGVFVQGQ